MTSALVSARPFGVPTLGIQTRAWQYGDPAGTPLILVHGFRGDHHGLEEIAREVAAVLPSVRTIVPDLPGFGETPAIPGREHTIELYGEWLRAFAAEVAPEGHAILGHSFGSLVVSAAIAGGLDPSRIILINPISAPALEGPKGALTKLTIGYYRTAEILPAPAAKQLLGNPLIVRAMSEVMAKTGNPELRAWIHGQHAQYFSTFSDPSTLLQSFRASVSHTVLEYCASFDRPTLLIAGERDDITDLSKQLELKHRVPGSRLRIIPGTGHLVHYEAVADAVAFISEFLVETAADTPASTVSECVA
ncbi:alpha/beta hydrolase [Leucobacter insecticola]|uniref:Alpha/beta hydrolase n=1 Tax=Leucobacter insecticola TaxID=2714934 RepID=A0A6G8FJ58_9MICO|nr:alpha/beta hydrolase [Leucobacter insecticola]QIM16490.1 alpha/beta hydrolase [Leucobacter insecticola]